MNIPREKEYRPRNNFLTAVLYIVLMAIVIVTLLFLFFYRAFSDFAKEQMIDSSRTVTESVCYSISEMNESIRNLCVSQFSSSDVQYLMHAETVDSMEVQQTITRLKRSASANLNVQAIVIFNRKTGRIFSTFRGIADIDEDIKQILQEPDLPYLTPIPRVLEKTDYYSSTPVFSYVIYDSYSAGEISSAIIVNIYAGWLSGSLENQASPDERLLVFDDSFRQLACTDSGTANFEQSAPAFCKELLGTHGTIETVNGEKYFVSMSAISGTNWYLLRQVSYATMLQRFRTLEQKLLLFTTVGLLLAIMFAFIVVRRIYLPIRKIAHTLQMQSYTPAAPKRRYDALNYISQAIDQVDSKYRDIEQTTAQLVRKNMLRAMLLGITPSGLDPQQMQDERTQLRNALSGHTLCLVRIDNISAFFCLDPERRTQIIRHLAEILSQQMPIHSESCLVDTAPGDFAAFLLDGTKARAAQIRTMQRELPEQTGFSVSVFLEDTDKTAPDSSFQQRFQKLLLASKYRMFDGCSCLIQGLPYLEREHQPLRYPESIAAALKTAMRQNDETESLLLYDQFSVEAQENSVDHYKFCMMQLFACFQSLLEERSSYALANVPLDMDTLYHTCFHAEFAQQLDDGFRAFIIAFCTMEHNTADKHSVVLETVKDYVELHYADKELSLKMIAAELHLSQSYLGKLFREAYGLSVKDYITQIRLEAAAKNLTGSSMSIKRVMELSGYDNESNFYRLFKGFYGVTPSSYRLSHSIQKTMDSPET